MPFGVPLLADLPAPLAALRVLLVVPVLPLVWYARAVDAFLWREHLLLSGEDAGLILSLYLLHVFPLPPGPAKLTEWITAKLRRPPVLVPVRGEG